MTLPLALPARLAPLLLCGTLGACSLFVDFDELGGDAAAEDAQVVPGTSSGNDAAAGSSSTGSGGTDAAVADAAVDDGSSEPVPFCRGQGSALFCDDFDEGAVVGATWTSVSNFGGFSLLDQGVSPPRALQLRVSAASSTVSTLNKTLVATTGLHVELEIRKVTGTFDEFFPLLVDLPPRDAPHFLALVLTQNGGAKLQYVFDRPPAAPILNQADIAFVAPDVWTHLAIDVVPTSNGGWEATGSVGTSTSAGLTLDLDESAPSAEVIVQVGMSYSENVTEDVVALYDNVLVR